MHAATDPVAIDDADRSQRLTGIRSLPLVDRVRLLTGATPWALHGLDSLDLAPVVVSDGPIGVRGVDEELTPSAQLPSPSAVAATWNPALAARLGTLVAREARRKNIDVVLAPVVNLQRTPVGGRHFECFSEDPLLTARIATDYVAAAQAEGVGMCVKHFVGNESETDRTNYVARIDERTLREAYLAPFETVVHEGGAWSVMAAYNRVDDGVESAPATEHRHLVVDVLKREWGFDGVVISDWLATGSTVESANGGLDLVMPGPGGPWEQHLLDAVEAGEVSEDVIDEKVERILTLARRVGAIGRPSLPVPGVGDPRGDVPAGLYESAETRALLREAVARSTVVLRNDGTLPLKPAAVHSIALIGPNAVEPFIQGGGSAFVHAPYASLPAEALRDALPDAALTLVRGGSGRRHVPRIDSGMVTTPDGAAGYELALFDVNGAPIGAPAVVDGGEDWNRHVPLEARRARIRARVRLTETGHNRLEVGLSGAHTVRFDGEVVSESSRIASSDVILDSSANHPEGPGRDYEVREPVVVEIDADVQVVDAEGYGTFVRFALRHEATALDTDGEIAEAVEAARAADVAIVIVGTNEETESEGWDRTDLDLPARQNELVRRVAEANPRTVVVVNAGGPVELPWLDDVAAVLWWWLPGQEAGNGLADALLGRTEPSGRLPWTLPAHLADCPVPDAVPVNGIVDYAEGVHVGHRGWDRLGRTPAREFGFGLGYTTWDFRELTPVGWQRDARRGDEFVVEVEIANTGERTGRATVQVYLADPADAAHRPVRWLAGFGQADAAPGQATRVRVRIPRRSFETWDVASHSWKFVSGTYRVHAGRSSRDLPLEAIVDMAEAAGPGASLK
ncbi:glycoside hydrolase family 3 C-terminal domain-containing protein [Microbacterium sp. STN6]|uniref:beta-glucosidase family protein n=1 Tax=Microbacterium sp. STN6 TaxID=2995588 RepID=UPI002260CFBE|nr:glycoside hydrolase family 3 C-terminal domain-containing protein [Microbacterium sp. STN6]MCX7522998.1 glycoside hydrolase family 3 C-terminal domain-containing protein [Microbacterium sp. STN6]